MELLLDSEEKYSITSDDFIFMQIISRLNRTVETAEGLYKKIDIQKNRI